MANGFERVRRTATLTAGEDRAVVQRSERTRPHDKAGTLGQLVARGLEAEGWRRRPDGFYDAPEEL